MLDVHGLVRSLQSSTLFTHASVGAICVFERISVVYRRRTDSVMRGPSGGEPRIAVRSALEVIPLGQRLAVALPSQTFRPASAFLYFVR